MMRAFMRFAVLLSMLNVGVADAVDKSASGSDSKVSDSKVSDSEVSSSKVAASKVSATDVEALAEELRSLPFRILYEAYDGDNWELFVMNADGTEPINITNTKDVHEFYPQASPGGSLVCFLADVESDGDTIRSVYVMDADGGNRRLVAEKSRQPCWSSDGKEIAFVKQEFKRFQVADYASKGLFIYNLSTGQTRGVPNKKVEHLYNLAWSPDGKWIVSTVHGGMGFGHAIIAIEIDGHRVVNLNIGGCRPCLSSDGQRITWSPNSHKIHVADIKFDGDEPAVTNIRVVDENEDQRLYHPDFSPDGKYIAYSVGGDKPGPRGPGVHKGAPEMVAARGNWNLFVRRVSSEGGFGPRQQLTKNDAMSNEESEWIHAR